MTPIEKVQLAAFLVGAPLQTLFVLIWLRLRWWSNYVTKSLFWKSLTIAVMYDIVVINVFVNYRYEEHVEAFLFWSVTTGIIGQLVALLFKRREVRHALEVQEEGRHADSET